MENQDRIIAESFTVPHTRKVVSFLIRKPLFAFHERDDLQQELLMYVWRKQDLFNKERGNAEAFVTMLVTSCVRMMIRARRRAKRNERIVQSIDELAGAFQNGNARSNGLGGNVSLEDGARRCGNGHADVPAIAHRIVQDRATRSLVPSEHHQFLVHVSVHGVAGAARLHGLSRRQAQNVVRRIGDSMVSRAAASAAA